MLKYKMLIEGMNCEGCVRTVKRTIENFGGKNVNVSLDEGYAEFEIESYSDEIKKDIEKKGYKVREVIKL
ncbi:MAG: heavy metal-associated domain-containing protein [candidate division WOR-3 bacterium]